MMKTRQSLNLSLTLSLAALSLVACQPASLVASSGSAVQTAVQQVQATAPLAAGTLNGVVASFNGTQFTPVSGATVTIDGTSFTAHTDDEGRYTMSGVAAGNYKVTASKDGMVSGTHEVVMNAVMGTPRVNLAMQSADRSLLNVPNPVSVTVSGVVTDPRGSALGAASIKVLCNVGGANNTGYNSTSAVPAGIFSDAAGFYTVSIPAVSVSPTQPGQVQVTAHGTSPGGVALETTDVYAYNLTTATLVANPQCKAFTQPGTPTFPNGSFGNMGTTTQIEANWLSSRSDEFYVELYCAGNPGTVSQTYGVLPDSVTNTAAAGATAPFGVATFRIPLTLPGPTFYARIIPFGLTSQFGNASLPGHGNPTVAAFVTNYSLGSDLVTPGTFESDISFAGNTPLLDQTSHAGSVNSGLILGTDTAQATLTIYNNNLNVSQDLQINGTAPVGTSGMTASYIAYTNGVAAPAVALPAADVVGPDVAGNFHVNGFNMPVRVGVIPGHVDLSLNFTTPFNMTTGFGYILSNFTTKMVSANLTKTLSNPLNSSTLTASDMDTTNITLSAKTYVDDLTPGNGLGTAKFTITPVGSTAAGAIRIVDRSFTNSPVGTSALLTGTAIMPADGTPIGFGNGDVIVISDDLQTNKTIPLSTSTDMVTLENYFLLGAPELIVGRDANNHFYMKRSAQGTLFTVQFMNTSSANVATKLGLAAAGATAAGTNGASAEFTGTGAFATTLPGGAGSIWALTQGTSTQNLDGSVSAAFTLTPPATFAPGDTFQTPINVSYRLRQQGGAAMTVGNGATAPYGATLTAINTSTSYTDTTKDQAVGKSSSDGPATPF